MVLPLDDASMQAVNALSVKKVTSHMPPLHLKHSLSQIKAKYLKNKKLQRLKVPKELCGEINMILGIAYN